MIEDPILQVVDKYILPFATSINLTLDITKQTLNLIFLLIFSLTFAYVKSPKFRHYFSFFGGVFVLLFDYGLFQTLIFLAIEASTYLILLSAQVREHPLFVMSFAFFFNFAVLTYFYVTAYGVWQMDISTPIMLYVEKASSLAWNLYDYKHKDDKDAQGKTRKMSKHLLRNTLKEVPSVFHYFGYMNFPVSVNLGPSVEFQMYMEGITNTKIPQGNKRYKWVLQNIFGGVLSLIYFLHPSFEFHHDKQLRAAHSILWRFFYGWAHIHWIRVKYFCAWSFTDAFMIICGMGYEEGSWEHAISMFPLRIETARRPRDFVAFWNCGTQRFLKYYIYVRGPQTATGKIHPVMVYVTYIMSACWHGWYSGYYFMFGGLMFLTMAEKWYYEIFPLTDYDEFTPYGQLADESGEGKEKKKKSWMEKGWKYSVRLAVEWFVVQSLFDWCAGGQATLVFGDVISLYSFMGYIGWIAISIIFVSAFALTRLLKKKDKKGDRKKTDNGQLGEVRSDGSHSHSQGKE